MRTFTLALCVLMFMASSIQAQEITLSTGVRSQYMVDPGFILHENPILTGKINLSHQGFYADVWISSGLDRPYGNDSGDEVDISIGYSRAIPGGLLAINASHYFLYRLRRLGDDLWIVDSRVDFAALPHIQPYLMTRHFGSIGADSPTPGWFTWFGFIRSQPLGVKSLMLVGDASFALALAHPMGGKNGLAHARLGTSITLPISRNLKLIPSFIWHIPRPHRGYVDDQKFVFMIVATRKM